MGQASAGDNEDAFEVCVDEFVPVHVRCRFQGDGGRVYASAVEDVVDTAEGAEGGGHKGFDLCGVAHVNRLGVDLG